MIDNWKDEKKCLETEKHPPKSTKYATSATNLQIGPYAISKWSKIHVFACIHLRLDLCQMPSCEACHCSSTEGCCATKDWRWAGSPCHAGGEPPSSQWRALPSHWRIPTTLMGSFHHPNGEPPRIVPVGSLHHPSGESAIQMQSPNCPDGLSQSSQWRTPIIPMEGPTSANTWLHVRAVSTAWGSWGLLRRQLWAHCPLQATSESSFYKPLFICL